MTYISSQSLSMPMRLSVMQAQSDMATAQSEVSTGVYADIGLTLGARTGTSLSMKSAIDQLTSFKTSNDVATTRLDATSNTLDAMLTAAQGMSKALITASAAGGLTAGLTTSAQGALQSLVAGLNTSAGNQFIFGGIKTDNAPVAAYAAGTAAKQAVDNAFQTAFGTSQSSASASSISGADMQTFLDGSFASLFSAGNWQATWSGASSQAIETQVAPSQSTTTSVSANETAFRQIAQAYTMLSEFTGANLSDGARAAVVSSATKLVNTAISGLTDLQAGVGIAQATVASATDQSSAQIDLLTSHVHDLESVDTYALSTKITQLQTQLQASYSLTSQLSKLSLVNYLTAG